MRLTVLGDCAFTAGVALELIRKGRSPNAVVIDTRGGYKDPFKNLRPIIARWWFHDHKFYYGGWLDVLRRACMRHSVGLYETDRVFDCVGHTDVLLVAGFRRRVPRYVLDQFGPSALNAHPSLLPSFGGPEPEARAILSGERRTGVTIHSMTEQFDDGPIRYQCSQGILPGSTVGFLERRGARAVAWGMLLLLNQPVSEWPTLAKSYQASYFPEYDSEVILDLDRCRRLDEIGRLLRLRPEGYAFTYVAETCVHPIRIRQVPHPEALRLDIANTQLYAYEWVEVASENALHRVVQREPNNNRFKGTLAIARAP